MTQKYQPKIKIKPEFKNLIRPLLNQEYLQLEENILRDGCIDPIILWRGFIIDGHNRYEICTRHNIPFKTQTMRFGTEEDAIIWICMNQLGRRNISEETRKFLIGMQYETEKIANSKKNSSGSNQYINNESEDEFSKLRTAERIGNENHVSAGTVRKYAIYTRALETIGKKVPDLVPKILSGKYKLSHNNIIQMSRQKKEDLQTIDKRINKMSTQFVRYSTGRTVINSVAPKPEAKQTVKDMPSFDPDAEVTELTLTMPTWVSSINRTRANANLNIISPRAKHKLINALENLKNTANDLLILVKED